MYGYVKNPNAWVDVFGLHEILSDNDIVARGGTCSAENFVNGAEVNNNGVLEGISTQAKPNANIETLSQPFKNGKVGTTTVGQIEEAGGEIILDGVSNSVNGKKMANHATINGLTGEELEKLFREGIIDNPVPKENRGCS